MKIGHLIVGSLQSNCYIVYDEKSLESLVIDPGEDAERIIKQIEDERLKVRYIVCTHGHFDHIGAVATLRRKTGAAIVLHRQEIEIYRHAAEFAESWDFHIEQPPEPHLFVEEGSELIVGGLVFSVLHTPGHSPGGICLYGQGVLFSGDTIFAGSVGRTDFYGGDVGELKKSFRRLISLPQDTVILSGHGGRSTIGNEIITNFFVHEI